MHGRKRRWRSRARRASPLLTAGKPTTGSIRPSAGSHRGIHTRIRSATVCWRKCFTIRSTKRACSRGTQRKSRMDRQAIHDTVKTYILEQFLQGEDPNELTDDTPLMTTGILDSLATLKLVTYLEEKFDIAVEAHEADSENLNTLELITDLVARKKK